MDNKCDPSVGFVFLVIWAAGKYFVVRVVLFESFDLAICETSYFCKAEESDSRATHGVSQRIKNRIFVGAACRSDIKSGYG